MRKSIEVWVAVDADGNYRTGNTDGDAVDRYRDEVSDDSPIRMIRIELDVPLPTPLEVSGRVEDNGVATLTQIT